MHIDEEIAETIRQSIIGLDNYILVGLTIVVWGTAYAVISLIAGNYIISAWIGFTLAILGLYAILTLLIDFIEYRSRKSLGFSCRFFIFISIYLILLLSVYRILPPDLLLKPLDIITDNLFYVLIIPLITRDILDVITVRRYGHLEFLRVDRKSEEKLEFILLTVLIAIIYGVVVVFFINSFGNILNLLIPIPIMAVIPYIVLKSNFMRNRDIEFAGKHIFKILLHIIVFFISIIFLFRAWLIYSHRAHTELLEVVAGSTIVITGVLHSARKLRDLRFTTPRSISKFLFGLTALGIGGIVIAVLLNVFAGIGESTVDMAMVRLYIAHCIGMCLALVLSIANHLRCLFK